MGKSETGLMSDYRFTAAVESFERNAELARNKLVALREQRANDITSGEATNFTIEAQIARWEATAGTYEDVARQLRTMSDLMAPKTTDDPATTGGLMPMSADLRAHVGAFDRVAREFRAWKDSYGWDSDVKGRAEQAITYGEAICEILKRHA